MSMSSTPLMDPPSKAISRVRYPQRVGADEESSAAHLLSVSSWDGLASLYDTTRNCIVATHRLAAPALDVTFVDVHARRGVVASGSGETTLIDWGAGGRSINGVQMHEYACSSVERTSSELVLSGGWDGAVKLWDTRTNRGSEEAAAGGKVFAMAIAPKSGFVLLVATSKGEVVLFDMRKLREALERRVPTFTREIRSISVNWAHSEFICSSAEGKVAWDSLIEGEAGAKKYAFKCHKSKDQDGNDVLHSVNSVAFHPQRNVFATGGSDGGVVIWDGRRRKRVAAILPPSKAVNEGVSSLSFSPNGERLAIGLCYSFEDGPREPEPPRSILVRSVSEAETCPVV